MMTPANIIARKRDGHELTENQIDAFVQGFTSGDVADYQMSALAMAIYLNGMTTAETAALTRSMLDSGVRLQHPPSSPPIVDKHSTGGIGDKVTLVLVPLLACCGLRVPTISGRGLGPTGGTLDKLESIRGLRTDLTLAEIDAILGTVGCAITGATAELAPADRKLYALRDVTATVASIPLITASIMSKKLAEGLDALVLDVKCGSGAFMKSVDQARQLAKSLVSVGHRMGVKTTAIITDMNQPLGRMVGNAVEVNESVDVLTASPTAPADLIEVTLALGGQLLQSIGHSPTRSAGEAVIMKHIQSGAGYEKFLQMVAAQGGVMTSPLERATPIEITSETSGYIAAIDTESIGRVIVMLGGGRRVASDSIDPTVGLEMLVRIGDPVDLDQPVMHLFVKGSAPKSSTSQASRRVDSLGDDVITTLRNAITLSPSPPIAPPLVMETFTGQSICSTDADPTAPP